MCFSATASFSTGTVLIAVGTLTLNSARRPQEVPFAAIPLLFAIQQLSEGVIWLTFRYEAPLLNVVMTHVYSFFSDGLWPAWVPLAVLLIEPPGGRMRALHVFVLAGVAVGAYLLYNLLDYPPVSRPTSQHIEYVSPHFHAATVMTLYLLSITVSPVLSSYPWVRLFGVLSFLAFGCTVTRQLWMQPKSQGDLRDSSPNAVCKTDSPTSAIINHPLRKENIMRKLTPPILLLAFAGAAFGADEQTFD